MNIFISKNLPNRQSKSVFIDKTNNNVSERGAAANDQSKFKELTRWLGEVISASVVGV